MSIPFPGLTAAQLDELRSRESEFRALLAQRRRRKIDDLFPDAGPLRRALYPKQRAFFIAGGKHEPLIECPPDCDGSPHRERLFLAANRVGKTVAAAYEMTCHLTGIYPSWWKGARFYEPVMAWAVNDTHKNTRDVNQLELYGPFDDPGTGMIPADAIVGVAPKSQPARAIESISVRHASGGVSIVLLKSYEQGWSAFTGAAIHIIWLDEEPPQEVYSECLMRTMTTQGLIMLTFTPLQGTTPLVKGFLDTLAQTQTK